MFIDAHSHLEHYNSEEIDKVLEQINNEKIITISNSMDISSYMENLNISGKSDFIIPTFGVHPWNAFKYSDKLNEIEKFIYETPIVGEVGLDFYWVEDKTQFDSQIKVFKFFLEKAKEQNKIINIHTKGAEGEVLYLLERYNIERAIIHWYSGPKDILFKMIERGYYFTVGVEIFYSDKIKSIAKNIPINRILTETDGPSSQEWLVGERGMPIDIDRVIQNLSEIKQVDYLEMKNIVFKNLKDLYYEKDLSKMFDM
ncbi:TatD family hydrolase [Clostridium sp. MB40-C1]|uniref:TatD family hydrolase n=1 Tax=Clostridium sp. MB40-C1 TaxID=3070996 RepID=UPI0027E112C5|nr:TatD family hydrolase [Clostridium sp. MB40-C1]WMJ80227.1 TatD family hydrolase [Clostridium sp. MB40-C1]